MINSGAIAEVAYAAYHAYRMAAGLESAPWPEATPETQSTMILSAAALIEEPMMSPQDLYRYWRTIAGDKDWPSWIEADPRVRQAHRVIHGVVRAFTNGAA